MPTIKQIFLSNTSKMPPSLAKNIHHAWMTAMLTFCSIITDIWSQG